MDRPVVTLFMLMSLDGKISTGATDALDFDADLPHIPGAAEGLRQYYAIEQTTDLWSLNSGRVQAKMGVNDKPLPEKTPVSFVLLDNHHLTARGVQYFCARSREFVLITANRAHPAFDVTADNLHILYQPAPDLPAALRALKSDYGCERLTLQTGGTLNALFLRAGLVDFADIVVAPVLVGGKDTATLADGESFRRPEELPGVRALELLFCEALEHSYLRLRYRVLPQHFDRGGICHAETCYLAHSGI